VWDFNAAEGDKIRLDPAFGIVTAVDLQSHLSGFNFEGANYTVISFPDSVDQLTIKGIAPGARGTPLKRKFCSVRPFQPISRTGRTCFATAQKR
jgi:hypothetical protein